MSHRRIAGVLRQRVVAMAAPRRGIEEFFGSKTGGKAGTEEPVGAYRVAHARVSRASPLRGRARVDGGGTPPQELR